MPTLEEGSGRVQNAVDALERAAAGIASASLDLDSIIQLLSAVGATGPAHRAGAAKQEVEALHSAVRDIVSRGNELQLKILAIGNQSTTTPPAAMPEPSPVEPSPGWGGGFDPGAQRGPLGVRFRSGVHDPQGLFKTKETRIADRLARDDLGVHPRSADDTVHRKKNPDAMVRASADDPGTVTEFKTLASNSGNAVKANILAAGKQVAPYGGGDAVIDGRDVQLDEQTARKGHSRAVGQARQHGQPVPDRVRFIIADGSILNLPEA